MESMNEMEVAPTNVQFEAQHAVAEAYRGLHVTKTEVLEHGYN